MDYIEGEYWARGENTPQGYASAYAARDGVIWDTAVDVVLRLAEASGCPVHIAHMQTAAVDRRGAPGQGPRPRRHLRGQPLGAVPVDVGATSSGSARTRCRTGCRTRTGRRSGPACATAPSTSLSSDHAPHTREEKEIGWTQMWSAHTGTPGIQYYYPLLLDAVAQGELTLERVVALVAGAPAAKFGLARPRARSRSGCDADIVIADLDTPWTITNDERAVPLRLDPVRRPHLPRQHRAHVRPRRGRLTDGKVVGEPGAGRLRRSPR